MDSELDVRRWLVGLDFPASRREVVSYARSQGAPAFVVMSLENIPPRRYRGAAEVAERLTTIGPDFLSRETSEAA